MGALAYDVIGKTDKIFDESGPGLNCKVTGSAGVLRRLRRQYRLWAEITEDTLPCSCLPPAVRTSVVTRNI
jgi:hypothetical protein